MPEDKLSAELAEVAKAIKAIPLNRVTRIAGNGMNGILFGYILGLALITTKTFEQPPAVFNLG